MSTHYSTLISALQLEAILNHPDLRLFDCRFNLMDVNKGYEDFKQGHIKNSQYADLDKQLASQRLKSTGRHPLPDKNEFELQIQSWGIDDSSQVVVYDDVSGAIASRLWWLCKWAGLDNVAVLDGGLKNWDVGSYPLSKKLVSFKKTNYKANFDDGLWTSTQEIENLITDSSVVLTDARAANRYNGESEPIDSIAGHISGALNFPFENNLDSQGCFLDKRRLRAIHQQTDEISQVVSMCGSGVTACHNILARAQAGLNPGQLYVGSWSEWITDPNRVIE